MGLQRWSAMTVHHIAPIETGKSAIQPRISSHDRPTSIVPQISSEYSLILLDLGVIRLSWDLSAT
jgi:hypothetical protein